MKKILKPCPFCGGTDIGFTSGEDSELWAYCEDCLAGVRAGETNPTPYSETEDANGLNEADREQCGEAWNTRHVPESSEALALDPDILIFAKEMQKRLEANAGRGDWKEGLTGIDFDDGVRRNLRDLKNYGYGYAFRGDAAVDLANFALMHWASTENIGSLSKKRKST